MAKLFLFIGKSASGKTFIVNKLAAATGLDKKFVIIRKKTTRGQRSDETTEEFEFNSDKKEIMLCDINYEYRGNRYGFNKADIENILKEGAVPITVIRHVETVFKLKQIFPNAVTVYCRSSLDSIALREFLISKGFSAADVDIRLSQKYEKLLEDDYKTNGEKWYDYEVYNNYDESFFNDVMKIIKHELRK